MPDYKVRARTTYALAIAFAIVFEIVLAKMLGFFLNACW